ncbi:MAG: hypothetical protein J07HB67_02500 [halophilic archaeon J07HB67]|nr:MAG: hypothetical protein J07HB67_02500 [halophilic archaeon J07HB67]
MSDTELEHACALLSVMLSHHCWGSTISRDVAVNLASVPSDGLGRTKDDFETLRTSTAYSFIGNRGSERVTLETDEFGALARFLHETCGWSRWKIDSKLKHFEMDEFGL